MNNLSPLRNAVNNFLSVYHGANWSDVLQDEIERLEAPCSKPDFNGECMYDEFCPLKRECEIVYEVSEALYRSRLKPEDECA